MVSVAGILEFGDPTGSPLVALHGNGSAPQQWGRLATESLPRRRWICPTLPGHQGEPALAVPFTLDDLAAGVVTAMDSIGIDQSDLIGSSLGGRVAMAVARAVPSRIRRMVLLDPPLMSVDEWARWRARRESSLFVESAFDDLDAFIAYSSPQLPPSARESARTEAAAVLATGPDARLRPRVDPDAYRGALDAIARELASADRGQSSLGAFAGKVLMLVAMQSDVVSEIGRAGLAAELGTRLRFIELDSGHAVLWDAYEPAAAAIDSFLVGET